MQVKERSIMIKKHLYILVFLLCIFLLTIFQGCKRAYIYPSDLKHIDSLSTLFPDSALSLLKQMFPTLSSRSKGDQMYANLLTLKAKNYAFESLSEDTIVFDIVDYYKENGDNHLLTQAYYYAGKVEKERLNIAQSMDYFFKVIELCANEDLKIKSQAYSQLNYLYNQQWLDNDALLMCKLAHSISIMLKDTTKMIYELRDMGNLYYDLGHNDSSYVCYMSAFTMAKKQKNAEMEAAVAAQIARYYTNQKDYIFAKKYIDIAQNYNDFSDRSSVLSIAADIYKGLGMNDSVIVCYQNLYNIGSVYTKQEACLGLANYYSNKNEHEEIRYFKEYEKYSDSIQAIEATQYIQQKKDIYEYNKNKERIEKLEVRNNIQIFIIIILIFSILIIICFSLLIYRNKKQREQIQRINNEKKKLSICNIDEINKEQKLKEIKNFDIFHRIEETLNSNHSSRNLSMSEWNELSDAVNKIWPEFKDKLYNLCSMSTSDYHLCLLIKIELSIKEISKLTQKSKSGVVSVRTKLYYRAFGEKKGAKEWDTIILSL